MRAESAPSRIRPVVALVVALLVIGSAGACGGSGATDAGPVVVPPPVVPPPTGPVATTSVDMRGSRFAPSAISVASGATVTFTNSDGINHNVTFDSQSIAGASNFSSGSVSVTMPAAAGTYPYQCTIHGGMTGTVQVK